MYIYSTGRENCQVGKTVISIVLVGKTVNSGKRRSGKVRSGKRRGADNMNNTDLLTQITRVI